jgi:NAD-dependent dihydropyrimidine dehydrogenase PreA subunit
VTYVIGEACVDIKDKACLLQCPVDCIYEGSRMLYIHPDECIDCGACEPLCPQGAIQHEFDLPAEQAGFAVAAAELFAEVGSPGGSAGFDLTERDHPMVQALPPRG